MLFKAKTVISFLLLGIKAQEFERNYDVVTCPVLECSSTNGNDKMDAVTKETCFLMQKEDVNIPMYARECYDESRANKKAIKTFCGFDAQSGEFAWVEEDKHYMEQQRSAVGKDQITDDSKMLSQFRGKKLSAECKEIIGIRKDLLPGRFCTDSYQCRSSYCKQSRCVGRPKDESCTYHDECDNGLYCRMQENWPYYTTCATQKNSFERCEQDLECQNNQFCWYPSKTFKEQNKKVCMEKFSQDKDEVFGWDAKNDPPTFEDFKRNGLYCASGLAYPMSADQARCTEFKEMMFNGAVIDAPFKCVPTNPKIKCELYFSVHEDDMANTDIQEYLQSRNKIENNCKCALDGIPNSGYCQSIIGTELYEKAVWAHQHMMSDSNCHTLDRDNLRAQKDRQCGVGDQSSNFRFAVDKMFNVTYWPYIQKDETYWCIRRFFSDSYDTLILEQAQSLRLALFTLAALGASILV